MRALLEREGSSSAAPSPSATATVDTNNPAELAAGWATAWAAGDYATLYRLLDPESQRVFPLQVFTTAYETFANETAHTVLEARPTRTTTERADLAVRLETAYFGTLEYSIQLRFTREGGRYAVSWDTTALHPDLQQGLRMEGTVTRPRRGAILDRDGQPLAITKDVRMLGLNRALVSDRAGLTAQLVAFGFTREQVDAAFAAGGGANQRIPVGPVPDEKAEEATLTLRPIPGVLLYFEAQRVHPLGPAAAHVVGYTRELTAEELGLPEYRNQRPGDRIGAVGLEASMEAVLAGKVSAELRLVDAAGATVKTYVRTEAEPGRDVQTTLSSAVLRAAHQRLGGRAGASVVIDPRTNEILAINSSPSYDPDAFERNDAAALAAITSAPGSPQTNRATRGLYSAGSTFKLITGAAGLLSGKYTPASTIDCSAIWYGIDPPRRNWEGSQGPLTIATALMRSCNPVFYEIGLTLYNETDGMLSEVAREFGFGSPTGVRGLGEEEGLVPDAAWKRRVRNEAWFPGDEVNLAIGQGDLLITPLQLANAYSSFLARELRTPVILASEQAESRGRIALSDAQYAHLKLGLELVTGPSGTANSAFANAGYTNFGGKSGTAEDAGQQQHVLFVAYAPKAAPAAVAAIVLDEGESGSIEAGPIARDIVLAALR